MRLVAAFACAVMLLCLGVLPGHAQKRVALVIGNAPFVAHSIKAPAATLPSLIVNNFGESTGTELSALFGAGLVLLVIGVAVNALARALVRSTARGGAASVAVA